MLTIRHEMPTDRSAIESLLDRCFGKDRRNKTSYRYRAGIECVRELSLVGEIDGDIAGTIRYWPVLCGGKPALLLGPLGIEPSRHNQGIGRTLVNRTLLAAGGGDISLVFLVGDPGYYTRFQFITTPSNIVMPGERPLRLQHRPLGDGRLPGGNVVIEPWPQSYTSLADLTGRQTVRDNKNEEGSASGSGMIAELSSFN